VHSALHSSEKARTVFHLITQYHIPRALDHFKLTVEISNLQVLSTADVEFKSGNCEVVL